MTTKGEMDGAALHRSFLQSIIFSLLSICNPKIPGTVASGILHMLDFKLQLDEQFRGKGDMFLLKW